MKKLLFIILILMFVSSCTPLQYVYVDPKDSVVKKQRVIYDNLYIPSPFFFNYQWGVPYYNPIIIQRPIITPRRPQYRPSTPQRPLSPRVPRNR
jgi:hypothetical protein